MKLEITKMLLWNSKWTKSKSFAEADEAVHLGKIMVRDLRPEISSYLLQMAQLKMCQWTTASFDFHQMAVHKRTTMLAHCNLKQNLCLYSKQSSFFSFYALPSGGISKDAVVHWKPSKISGFVCANHPASLGWIPKHNIFASSFIFELLWEKKKNKQKEAEIYENVIIPMSDFGQVHSPPT